ncbi:UDP-glycosyltransferase 73C6-like [Senna tora]|uniref:UDP-glycosyltransferase 73C6-like n=1 Tax=Senna tora TaxID=362788 RepID=A0A834WCV0_9FABA|nr:UDP-glycosyltransferase 73C6-like [Senna tora]
MASQEPQLHFVLFPMMAQGHMIPMIDIARILAQRNVTITIITTPQNAARFSPILARSLESGLQIPLVQLPLPCEEAGIPNGCENIDMLPSLGAAVSLFEAVEKVFEELTPRPSCIISDMLLHYTSHIAAKFNIPRIVFGTQVRDYGIIMNSFEELEGAYAREYNKKPKSVVYACLGSICNLTSSHLIQLGLALEASNRPFIWVLREGSELEDLKTWIKEDGFEERTKAQDQFFNEKLVVQILEIGIRVGVESPIIWGEEKEIRVVVKKEDIERAIEELMGDRKEGEERRKRVNEVVQMAKNMVR